MSTDQLARYIRNENQPPFWVVARLAAAAHVGLGWFATGVAQAEPVAKADDHGYVMVPRYDLRAGMGGAQVVESEQIVDYLAFRAEWVRDRLKLDPKQLLLLEAVGDSMTPTIDDGDLVLVSTADDQIRRDGVYCLSIEGELVIKRVQRAPRGAVRIISDNAVYPPTDYAGERLNSLRVIGPAVWHGTAL